MSDESYKYDVDENFIKKLLNKFTKNKNQKLLTSGNVKVKYTSESISSMWRKTTIKAALYQKLEGFTGIFIKTKQTAKNAYKPQIIGIVEEGARKDQNIIPETKLSDVAPIIPKAVSKTVKYNSGVSPEEQKDD